LVIHPILFLTTSQDFVMRKLSSALSVILCNLLIGIEKVSVPGGTKGRAETSNNPITARGLPASLST
jgi:hypothetical protein